MMKKADSNDPVVALSVEKIIELIRAVRNELITDLLKDDVLNNYYERKYNKQLSAVKREFFKRDLHDLLKSPVDLVHYSRLITFIKDTGTASLARENHQFFFDDIDRVVSRY